MKYFIGEQVRIVDPAGSPVLIGSIGMVVSYRAGGSYVVRFKLRTGNETWFFEEDHLEPAIELPMAVKVY